MLAGTGWKRSQHLLDPRWTSGAKAFACSATKRIVLQHLLVVGAQAPKTWACCCSAAIVHVRKALVALRRERQWQEAFWLLDQAQLHKAEVDTVCYNVALSIHPSRWAQALLILAQMERSGPQPNVVSYSTVISACEGSTCWRVPVSMVHKLRETGLSADGILLCAATSACCKMLRWQLAVQLAASARAWDVAPTVATLNAVMSAVGERWEQALEYFDGLKHSHCQLDVVSCGSAMQTCDRASQWEKVDLCVDSMSTQSLSVRCKVQ